MAAHPQSIQARAIRQSGRTTEVDTARAAESGEALPRAIQFLAEVMNDEKQDLFARIAAAKLILDRGLGKLTEVELPPEPVEKWKLRQRNAGTWCGSSESITTRSKAGVYP
jgi:hypothetical protein